MKSEKGEVILKRTISMLKPVPPGNADRNYKLQAMGSKAHLNLISEQALFMPLVRTEVTDIKCFSYQTFMNDIPNYKILCVLF